jgi:hypothetical protein
LETPFGVHQLTKGDLKYVLSLKASVTDSQANTAKRLFSVNSSPFSQSLVSWCILHKLAISLRFCKTTSIRAEHGNWDTSPGSQLNTKGGDGGAELGASGENNGFMGTSPSTKKNSGFFFFSKNY